MFKKIVFAVSSVLLTIIPVTTSAATCVVNGENIPCGEIAGLFGFLMAFIFIFPILIFIIVGLMIVSSWFVYEKAGKPGWASLIPIYNIVKMLEIIGKPTWWVLLMLVPLVNIVIGFIVVFELAKSFGKGTGFGLGLFFLPFIFFPILAFGKSKYIGVSVAGNNIPPATNTPSASL